LENVNMQGSGSVFLGDPCTPGDCTTRLKTTQYTNINRRSNNGFSMYNGVTGRIDFRDVGRSGLTLRTSYTWSHAIDNLSSVFSVNSNNVNLGLLDPFNPHLDKGDAEFDVRHRMAVSAIWDVPLARNSRGWLQQVAGGWQLAPIFTARTGAPFTLFDGTNVQF